MFLIIRKLLHSIILIMFMFTVSGGQIFGQDNNGNGVEDVYEPQLASKFAPILHYHENNPLFPVAVNDIYSQNDWDNQSTFKPLPISSHSPEAWEDYFYTTVQYLSPTVYYNMFAQSWQAYGGNTTTYYVLQYWFYYPFNDAGNLHEGEWEHVALILDHQNPSQANIVGSVFHQHYNLVPVEENRLEITSDGNGEHVNVYIGGKTYMNIFGLNLVRDDCDVGGFGEITGASFPRPGYHTNTWRANEIILNKIDLPIEMDENITVGRTLDYDEFTLMNLRNDSNPDLWWLGTNAYFGSTDIAIFEDTPVCTFPVVDWNVNYPKTINPPKDPTQPLPDDRILWDEYPITSSVETQLFIASAEDVIWPGLMVSLLADAEVTVKVYTEGEPPQLVRTLVNNEVWEAGLHEVIWHDEEDIADQGVLIFTVEASPGNILTADWYNWRWFRDETFRNVYNNTDVGGTLTLKQGIRTVRNHMPSETQERIFDALDYAVWTDEAVFENWQNTSDTIRHNNWDNDAQKYQLSKTWSHD